MERTNAPNLNAPPGRFGRPTFILTGCRSAIELQGIIEFKMYNADFIIV